MFVREISSELPEQLSSPQTQGFNYAAPDNETRIVIQHSPIQLNPHPRNEAIYGEEDVTELIEHIRESSWVKPLVCTPTGTIISGHRRWKAALELRLKTVPVEIREFSNELAELEALLLENSNRLKTTEQKVREAEAWKEVETHKAKTRQIVLAGTRPNSNLNLQENFPEGHKGQARDAIASRVGLGSGRNYEKAVKVVTQIDEEASLGHMEVAKVLRKVLNEQSVDAAHILVKKPPQERHAITNLIINGEAKTTKQAERIVNKDDSVEFNAPTQETLCGASIAELQVTIDSNFYKPTKEVDDVVVDNFNFGSNGHLNPPASGTPVPSSAGRNHSDPTDVSEQSSVNTPRPKAEGEISEICSVLSNIFSTVQHLTNEQKEDVFERLVYHVGAETLGELVLKSMHQYEIVALCHKCFAAMSEETFSMLEISRLKLSGLRDSDLEFLDGKVTRLLSERHIKKL